MLMGLTEVSKEGDVGMNGDPRVLYSVMMTIRLYIIKETGHITHLVATMATRYCSVRRQFSTQEGTKEERKIIDYQTTQHILAKVLARAYSLRIAGIWAAVNLNLMIQDI